MANKIKRITVKEIHEAEKRRAYEKGYSQGVDETKQMIANNRRHENQKAITQLVSVVGQTLQQQAELINGLARVLGEWPRGDA